MEYSELKGFKYRAEKGEFIQTDIRPPKSIIRPYATLTKRGRLYIKKGFCWDGASGAFDTEEVMRPSAYHDIGCAWYLLGLISDGIRKQFDDLFFKLLKEDGVADFRAKYMYKAVKVNTKIRYGI